VWISRKELGNQLERAAHVYKNLALTYQAAMHRSYGLDAPGLRKVLLIDPVPDGDFTIVCVGGTMTLHNISAGSIVTLDMGE
jgi:hypothetical protein